MYYIYKKRGGPTVKETQEEGRKKKKAKGQYMSKKKKEKKNSNVISNVTEKTFITCPIRNVHTYSCLLLKTKRKRVVGE